MPRERHAGPSPWTPERHQQLLDLLKVPKMRAKQIAEQLGGGLTKHAIIGRCYRLKLKLPVKGGGHGPNGETRAQLRAKAKLLRTLQPPKVKSPKREPQSMSDLAIPFAQRCQLMDLTNETCRWPIGEVGTPGFFFCGSPDADLMGGRPYCPGHTAKAKAKYSNTFIIRRAA